MELSPKLLGILGVVYILPWILMAGMVLRPRSGPGRGEGGRHPTTLQASKHPRTSQRKPGPWGDLETTRLIIEPPEDILPTPEAFMTGLRWHFKGYSAKQWTDLLATAGLTEEQRRVLSDPARWKATKEGVEVQPPPEIVLSLSPESRARIYTILSPWKENTLQHLPFRFRSDVENEWFEGGGLSDETEKRIRGLLYRRGTSLLFSDLDALMPFIHSDEEKMRLMKVLLRRCTLMMKLRLHPDSDIEGLSHYWGRGPRRKDLKPFLESLPREGEGSVVDVMHLIPGFARMRMYSYPFPWECAPPKRHDCHWTSLNFFSWEADERFSDPTTVRNVYATGFYPIPNNPMLGDLVLLADENGVFHSCVYIADNIVFTKNGPSISSPWLIMELDDVAAFYPTDRSFQTLIVRAKD